MVQLHPLVQNVVGTIASTTSHIGQGLNVDVCVVSMTRFDAPLGANCVGYNCPRRVVVSAGDDVGGFDDHSFLSVDEDIARHPSGRFANKSKTLEVSRKLPLVEIGIFLFECGNEVFNLRVQAVHFRGGAGEAHFEIGGRGEKSNSHGLPSVGKFHFSAPREEAVFHLALYHVAADAKDVMPKVTVLELGEPLEVEGGAIHMALGQRNGKVAAL